MKKGLFITFEGLDGCGKSTQIAYLRDYLQGKGFEVVVTREPGGCPISENIREILLDPQNRSMNMYTEALLYAAARAQLIDDVIKPAVAKGRVVLCDRFFDSSIAYQGYGRQMGEDIVRKFNYYAIEECVPDYTFFLDLPHEEAKRRMRKRTGKDRLEQEADEFFERIYEGFRRISRQGDRFIRIDVSGTKQQTSSAIMQAADEIIKAWQR